MWPVSSKNLGILIIVLVVGAVLGGGGVYFYIEGHLPVPTVTRINAQGANYKYITPLLAYDVNSGGDTTNDKNLETQLNDIISRAKQGGKASDVSVYFRGSGGDSVGINEADEYNPASLFKVPIMIAYLKEAESDPAILDQTITFNNKSDQSAPQTIPPSQAIQFGQTYTIEQLIEYMIKYSDNSAANILADRISLNQQNAYTEMLTELGLPVDAQQVSAKSYSLFLRILRNSTYLDPEMSEKAMGILVDTDFKAGLSAGVPSGIDIAQKFGEYGASGTEELHDCGIIYAAKPYLLCVMTRGTQVSDLESIIKDISQEVYTEAEK